MDAFVRGLMVADRVLADPRMSELRYGRYTPFDGGDGQRFEKGALGFVELRDIAAVSGEPEQRSEEQELAGGESDQRCSGPCMLVHRRRYTIKYPLGRLANGFSKLELFGEVVDCMSTAVH